MSRATVVAYDTGRTRVGPESWTPEVFSVPMVTPTGTGGLVSRTTSPIRRMHGNCIVPEGLQPGRKA